MNVEPLLTQLYTLRRYFQSGATKTYDFRRRQLLLLKGAILQHEHELHTALYKDLKKSPEECWITETGFLLAEINNTLKQLRRWMKPQSRSTNLLNFPSRSFIYKEPLGVVLVIGPWNYPLHLLFMPLVGAIAAGNCVVLKPSEFAPATATIMEKIIALIFPKEYVLYVQGDGAAVVPALMNNFRFDHVFYTGSTGVGKIIYSMAAQKLVPVTLELGGKSPCVVEKDANLKIAARRIAVTKFSNAGQMCVAPDYVLVHHSVKDRLVKEMKKCILHFFSDNPAGNYNYGKIINEKAFTRLLSYIKTGTVVHGGNYDVSNNYIQPTLLENVPVDTAVMGEEIFGPVLPIISFTLFEEAKEWINRNPNPLAFYVFTESSTTEQRWLDGVAFGGGCVNNAAFHLTNPHLPFGGRGSSGIGSYHGKASFDVFSHQKSIMKTPTWFDLAIKYPPYKGKLGLFKKFIK